MPKRPASASFGLPWRSLRKLLVAVGALLVFGSYNLSIFLNERTIAQGQLVRLALAPRDPRSLMTGDYMALRHAIQDDVRIAMTREPVPARSNGSAPEQGGDDRVGAPLISESAPDDGEDAGVALPPSPGGPAGMAPRTRRLAISDTDGYLVVAVDERRVARLLRSQPRARPVADGEVALRYRVRDARIELGSNAWFFEEGSAARYEAARFGEYRVDASGKMLLIRLLDEDLNGL